MTQNRKLEWRSISTLIPYARNSRTHSDEQIAQIAASIKEFGWTNPILVDGDNGIIAGHGRLSAARKLGHEEVPVIELKDLTETQRKAYIIADNKLALNAGWDDEMLRLELLELKDFGFSLDLTGFVSSELNNLFDENSIENLPDEFDGEVGNKWQLLIEYENENQLADAFETFKQQGFQCKIIQ